MNAPSLDPQVSSVPLLEADSLRVTFSQRRGRPWGRRQLQALRGVSLQVAVGETVGVVGESGSGKSTLARALLRLTDVSSGSLILDGRDITHVAAGELRGIRRKMQMVFQDPYASLDPSATVASIVGEPLRVHTSLSASERRDALRSLLRRVGLEPSHLRRYPHEFSGGQRQRIAIARAIATTPSLVVLDEAVSSLDATIQNQILDLLADLRAAHSLAYVFISHDLSVVRDISDHVVVLYLGSVMERGPTEQVYTNPRHPYTRALLSAVPSGDPRKRSLGKGPGLTGEIPDPANPPRGCPFSTRCPMVTEVCRNEVPALVPVANGGQVACHLVEEGAA